MLSFAGKTAVITGAAGGISSAVAELLHAGGARVVLTDIDLDAVQALALRLDATGQSAIALRQDAALPQDAAAVAQAAAGAFGGIDIVVPGAGLYQERPLAEMTDQEWKRVTGVNLDGVFYTVRAAIPHLRDGGAIVTVASMAGHKGSFRHGHYAAAKGGVLTLTRTLALELAPRIRVNAVSPGLIDTPMVRGLMAEKGADLLRQTPLGRLGTAEEVAAAIAFLCSDLARFITGETLHVNGGLYIAS